MENRVFFCKSSICLLARRRFGFNLIRKFSSSFRDQELSSYDAIISDWWFEEGQVKWLHNLNNVRVPLIYNAYVSSFRLGADHLLPKKELKDIKILDVGCGGGILSEALTAVGFKVTGIDPNLKMITLAKDHADNNRALPFRYYDYIHTTIEEFAPNHKDEFDGVVISEVLDRISNKDKENFLKLCCSVLKLGGSLFITCKSKTQIAFTQLLISRLTGVLPGKTQNWFLFIDPINVETMLKKYGCHTEIIRGLHFDVVKCAFSPTRYIDFWYFMHLRKR